MVTTQHKRPPVHLWTSQTAQATDVTEDVLSFSYQKSLADGSGFYGAAGQWSLTLMPRTTAGRASAAHLLKLATLYKSTQAQSMVSLGYTRPGGIMLGLVDSVSESLQMEGGQVARTLTLSGRDLGKVLEMDHIIRAPLKVSDFPQFIRDLEAELGDGFPLINDAFNLYRTSDNEVLTFQNESLGTVLNWILDRLPSMRLPVLSEALGRDPGRRDDRVRTWLDTSSCVLTWDDERIFNEGQALPQGTVISFIQSFLDADWYELWMDFRPISGSPIPQPVLVLRPKPFDEEPYQAPVMERTGIGWDEARTLVDGNAWHVVDLDQVRSASFGRSDAQAFSFYQVTNAFILGGTQEDVQQGLAFPLVDTWSMNRFGCRSYTPNARMVSGDPSLQAASDEGRFLDATAPTIIEKRNRLFNWYRLNPFYETGSVVVYGRDDFRVGDRVFLPWRKDPFTDTPGMEYYCTGTAHAYTDGAGYACTLNLSRGHNGAMVRDRIALIRRESSATVPNGWTAVNR